MTRSEHKLLYDALVQSTTRQVEALAMEPGQTLTVRYFTDGRIAEHTFTYEDVRYMLGRLQLEHELL